MINYSPSLAPFRPISLAQVHCKAEGAHSHCHPHFAMIGFVISIFLQPRSALASGRTIASHSINPRSETLGYLPIFICYKGRAPGF